MCCGGGDALDDLVEGQVERVAGGAGDDRVDGLVEAFQAGLLHERDAGGMRFDRVAGEDAGDFALLGEGHVEHEVVARHAGDLQQLGVQRIGGDGAFGGHAARA
jgi:hypothetical protein